MKFTEKIDHFAFLVCEPNREAFKAIFQILVVMPPASQWALENIRTGSWEIGALYIVMMGLQTSCPN